MTDYEDLELGELEVIIKNFKDLEDCPFRQHQDLLKDYCRVDLIDKEFSGVPSCPLRNYDFLECAGKAVFPSCNYFAEVISLDLALYKKGKTIK